MMIISSESLHCSSVFIFPTIIFLVKISAELYELKFLKTQKVKKIYPGNICKGGGKVQSPLSLMHISLIYKSMKLYRFPLHLSSVQKETEKENCINKKVTE